MVPFSIFIYILRSFAKALCSVLVKVFKAFVCSRALCFRAILICCALCNKRLGLVNTKVPLSTDVLPCSLADYLIFNQFCLEIDSISEINDENGKKKVTSKIIEIFMNRYFFKPGVHQYLFSCGSDRAMICFYWEPKISDGFWCIT